MLLRAFYFESSAYVRINGGRTKWFELNMGVCQVCVVSLRLFNVFRDGELYELKVTWGDWLVLLSHAGTEGKLP